MVKLNRDKSEWFYDSLRLMADKPVEGVQINSAYNVFGAWDCALWLEAEDNDAAVRFVSEKIRVIDGVSETMIMPTTAIDLHSASAADFVSKNLNVEVPEYFYVGRS